MRNEVKGEQLIIFDFFGVVFNKGLASSIDRLVAVLNKPEHVIESVYRKWEKPFDRGVIDEQTFWSEIKSELGSDVNSQILSNIVISAYRPKLKTIELARYLARKNIVIVYSNYRREWFSRLDELFNIEVNFENVILSSDTGLLKPDFEVFEYIEAKFGIAVENMLLLDDEAANVQSIRELGGKGVLFSNVFESEVQIRSLIGERMPSYDCAYSGILLQTKSGSLVLQRRDLCPKNANTGQLSLFGGRAKKNESAIDCAIRELQEETGIVRASNELRLLKKCGYPDESGRWVDCSFYLAKAEVNEVDLQEERGVEVCYPAEALMQQELTEVAKYVIGTLETMCEPK